MRVYMSNYKLTDGLVFMTDNEGNMVYPPKPVKSWPYAIDMEAGRDFLTYRIDHQVVTSDELDFMIAILQALRNLVAEDEEDIN